MLACRLHQAGRRAAMIAAAPQTVSCVLSRTLRQRPAAAGVLTSSAAAAGFASSAAVTKCGGLLPFGQASCGGGVISAASNLGQVLARSWSASAATAAAAPPSIHAISTATRPCRISQTTSGWCVVSRSSTTAAATGLVLRRHLSTSSRRPASFEGWNHYINARMDALGQTMRNPHYTSYLGSPSPLLGQRSTFVFVLIGVNVFVYLCWWASTLNQGPGTPHVFPTLSAFMYRHFTSSLANLREGRVWTLVTSGFSHQNLVHIGMNMMVLHMFASPVLMHIGPARFMVLYVGGAALCSIAHIAYTNFVVPALGGAPRPALVDRQVVTTYDRPGVGASGATMALFATFSCIYPRSKVGIMFIPYGIQARYMLPLFLGVELIWSVVSTDSFIAHWGHLGGALFGAAYYFASLRHHCIPTQFTHPATDAASFYRYLQRAAKMRQAADSNYDALIMGKPMPPVSTPSWTPPAAGPSAAFTPRRRPSMPKRTPPRPRSYSTIAVAPIRR